LHKQQQRTNGSRKKSDALTERMQTFLMSIKMFWKLNNWKLSRSRYEKSNNKYTSKHTYTDVRKDSTNSPFVLCKWTLTRTVVGTFFALFICGIKYFIYSSCGRRRLLTLSFGHVWLTVSGIPTPTAQKKMFRTTLECAMIFVGKIKFLSLSRYFQFPLVI
jgi:hypothetical protein